MPLAVRGLNQILCFFKEINDYEHKKYVQLLQVEFELNLWEN